ncbi:MAG: MATE family efflux transporter [Thalassobaculales bacterium]
MIGALLRLAVPVMLSRAGMLGLSTADTVMVGRTSTEELAYYAVATAPQVTMLTVGIGLSTGVLALVAQARGAGRAEAAGAAWRAGLLVGLAAGLAFALACLFGAPLLRLLGQSPAMAAGGGDVLRAFAWGMPGIALYTVSGVFLEAIGRPGRALAVVAAGNLVNIAGNWLLIDLAGSGAAGAAHATSAARVAMALLAAAAVLTLPGAAAYGLRRRALDGALKGVLRLGVPAAVAIGLESTAFTAISMFAGMMGALPLATYQVALNVVAMVFMLALGLMTAAAIQVGQAKGRGDRAGMARAGWTAAGICLAGMVAGSALVLALRLPLAAAFTADPALLAALPAAFLLVALILPVDGLQGVLMGVLRGAGDAMMPTALHLVSFWVVTVPAAYHLGFTLGHGVLGLLGGLACGLFVATMLLGGRFLVLVRRPA